MLRKIVENPYINLLAGIILMFTAGYETWESIEEATVGAHHGVLLFGFFHAIKSIPHILDGLEDIEKAQQSTKRVVNNKD